MPRLAGKVAFITGAGSGIGLASARLFAAEGAKVAIAEYVAELGDAAAKTIQAAGGEALATTTDVREESAVAAAIDATIARFGRIDVLFNCAGGSSGKGHHRGRRRSEPVAGLDAARPVRHVPVLSSRNSPYG